MATIEPEVRLTLLEQRYVDVREHTEDLAAPLTPEDQMVQSMPDVSPTKWHRGHTTWFFETFVLPRQNADYSPFHPAFGYIFNSYYEAIGSRQPRWRTTEPTSTRRWPSCSTPVPPTRRSHSSSSASTTSNNTKSCS